MDYELAQYNAARKLFPPETKVVFCSFHLAKKLRDNFRTIFKGIPKKKRLTCQIYPALRAVPFVPWRQSLIDVFTKWLMDTCKEYLPLHTDKMKKFVEYLTTNKSRSFLKVGSDFTFTKWPWAELLRNSKFSV